MTAHEILTTARGEIGVRESREGFVKYNLWYYGREVSYPWCMAFVQWVFSQAGADLLPVRTASCGTMMRAAKAAGLWVTSDYQPGDIAIYSFTHKRRTDHTGIIERVNGSVVTAIEGNTGYWNNAGGGQVMRRKRRESLLLGAVRPHYEKEEKEVRYEHLKDVPEQFRPVVQKLVEVGIILGSGEDGDGLVIDLSHDMVRMLVYGHRGGAFDRRFIQMGVDPVIPVTQK